MSVAGIVVLAIVFLLLGLGLVARVVWGIGAAPSGEPVDFRIEPLQGDTPTKTMQWSDQQDPDRW